MSKKYGKGLFHHKSRKKARDEETHLHRDTSLDEPQKMQGMRELHELQEAQKIQTIAEETLKELQETPLSQPKATNRDHKQNIKPQHPFLRILRHLSQKLSKIRTGTWTSIRTSISTKIGTLWPSHLKAKILSFVKNSHKSIRHNWKKHYKPMLKKLKKLQIFLIRVSRNILHISERSSAFFLHKLSSLLRPKKLLPNHRYYGFRRLLLLRQSFYFVVSLSCFSVLLASFWVFIGAQRWQDKVQKDLEQVFVLLEQEYGIQVRFKLQRLYLLHKIELRDIQVRLQVPLQGIKAQSDEPIPRIPPLPSPTQEEQEQDKAPPQKQKPQHLADDALKHSLEQILAAVSTQQYSPQQALWSPKEALQQLAHMANNASTTANTVASLSPTANQNEQQSKKLTLYISADHLQIKYSLLAMLQDTWRLYRVENSSTPDKEFAWQLFELLQNIKQVQFGAVDLQLVSLPVLASQLPPPKDKSDKSDKSNKDKAADKNQTQKPPFVWQDFLQTLRSFPIAVKSFRFHLNLQQQIFEAEDVRLVLQSQEKQKQQNTAKETFISKTWQAILSLFYPEKPSLLDEYNSTHKDEQSSYFFDLQGRFRSEFGKKSETAKLVSAAQNNALPNEQSPSTSSATTSNPATTIWGELHANGGLSKNLDNAYLLLEVMELYSKYTSLKPSLFKIEYLPQALKLETLSDIRALDLELNYLFQERLLDLKFASEQFRLGDYLSLREQSQPNNRNSLANNPANNNANAKENPSQQDSPLQNLKPLLDAQVSGEGQLQIRLGQPIEPEAADSAPKSSKTSLNYSGNIAVYLPQSDLLLNLNGQGDLQKFDAKAIKVSQETWQANFQGDISYDTLLPQGYLDFDWHEPKNAVSSANSENTEKEDSTTGYHARFTLQRSASQKNKSEDILLIDTVLSQFSGLGLSQSKAKSEAKNYAEPGSTERTLLSGLPPWAQPQLQLVVLHENGNYHISSQIHVPLDQQQLQYAELSLQQLARAEKREETTKESAELRQSLYKQKKLYPLNSLAKPSPASPQIATSVPKTSQEVLQSISQELFQSESTSEAPSKSSSLFPSDPFEPFLFPQDQSAFYLLPVLGLSGSIHLAGRSSDALNPDKSDQADQASRIKLELSTLQWQRDGIAKGAVPMPVLLGAQSPESLDFVLPGLDESFWQMHSSLLSDLKDFHLWLQDFQIKTSKSGRKFSLQGTISPEQIKLNELHLQWDSMDIANRFLWEAQEKQGYGILTIQKQELNYQLKRLALPIINQKQEFDFRTAPQFALSSGQAAKQGWLLQGDHELYAYTDGQNYQISFRDFPLPEIPGLSSTRLQDVLAASKDWSNSTLSLQARLQSKPQSQAQSQQAETQSPQVEIPLFQLKFPEGNTYFPTGAELHLVGSWQAKELLFEHLALYEPHRQLFGWGSLRFTKPFAPIYPAPQIAFESESQSLEPKLQPLELPEPSEPLESLGPLESPEPNNASELSEQAQSSTAAQNNSELDIAPNPSPSPNSKQAQSPATEDFSDWLQAPTQFSKPLEAEETKTAKEKEGYWVGEFSFQGSLTEAGIRQNVARVQGGESLELNFFTEGQNFFTSAEGRLDATRLNQVFTLLQKRNSQNLRRGTLKFKLEGEGDFLTPEAYSGANYWLKKKQKAETQTQISLQQLQGKWQLEDGEYAGHQLQLSSQLMWQDTDSNLGSNSWLFSNIQGNFGAIELERSFVSFRDAGSAQQMTGLLNYSLRLQNDYLSSIAINLTRSKQNNIWDVFSPVEQELLRWRGNLYSYPLRSSKTTLGQQSGASLAALGNNLRDNVFKETSPLRSGPVYPGFDIFVEPRITQDGVTELRLFRRKRQDLDIGLRADSFWLQVGQAFPISFRAQGSNDAGIIDAQVQDLLIRPELLNIFIPEDSILKKPVIQFSQGRIFGSLRIYGNIFDPSLDGSLNLQNIVLESPYFPGQAPTANVELISEGHIIMAKPFYIQFQDGRLYTPGYEEVYLRHKSLRILRYYLGFRAEGKEGVPLFYDVYGIQYQTNAKGTVRLEGTGQSGYLNADLELNHLLMQGSQNYNAVQSARPSSRSSPYTFSLDIRTKIGRSARLVYPRETSPIFNTRLNPRDELLISYDGSSRKGSIDGRVKLYDGELYLLGNQMDLRKGELVFDESFDYFSPEISLFFSLYSYDLQGQGVQINMDYQGELAKLADQNWSPNISSQPPLPEQRLRYLIAAQLSAGGEGQANSLATTQNIFLSEVLASLGSNIVLKPVEELIRKGFKVFDEVSLKTGLLGNLLDDYLGISYDTPTQDTWLKYLDNSHMSFGTYIDRDNTILLSFNVDLLYDPLDTSSILLSSDGLQFIPGLGLKFSTPLLDISLDVGFAHIDDFFITDSSILLEWSLSDFINRRRLVASNEVREPESEELVMYEEE